MYKKEEQISGGFIGCLHCEYSDCILGRIGVGFGSASLTRNDEVIFEEENQEYSELMSYEEAEIMASKEPEEDWKIHLIAPLSERHYQRQGERYWVLYKKSEGFA